MELEEALKEINEMVPEYEEIDPSKLTLDEIAQLRFTSLSEREEELVEAELKKRGL